MILKENLCGFDPNNFFWVLVLIFLACLQQGSRGEPIQDLITTVIDGIAKVTLPKNSSSKVPPDATGLSEEKVNDNNSSKNNNNTIAKVLDNALKKEFKKEEAEEKNQEGEEFNKTVQNKDAQLETVVHLSHNRQHSPQNTTDQNPTNRKNKFLQQNNPKTNDSSNSEDDDNLQDVENQAVDTLIDKKDNVFVISAPSSWNTLTLDPQFVQDLTIVISASAVGGSIFEMLRQPAVSGYLVAGSVVGPGGLGLIQELVQVESLAQIGIQLLLFGLGLEFSISKLWPVKYVAIFGGILQIFTFIFFGGFSAFLAGAEISEGILIGAIISMSSTSILVKLFDSSPRMNSQPFKQIVVGTLILQDCMVGLLFAVIPILGDLSSPQGSDLAAKIILNLSLKLSLSLIFVWLIGKYLMRVTIPLIRKHASPELFQLGLIGWCMFGAWVGGALGISQELGAFLAGSMLSGSDESHFISQTTEQIRNVFVGLFICSIGLIMSPLFLWRHFTFLGFGTVVVVVIKTVLVSSVVIFFRYSFSIGFAVGTCLAQIGEFAFVLLGIGLKLKLISQGVYLLMLGVTALSILITPLVLKITEYLLRSTQFEQELNILPVVSNKSKPKNQSDKSVDSVLERINSNKSISAEGCSQGTSQAVGQTRSRKSVN